MHLWTIPSKLHAWLLDRHGALVHHPRCGACWKPRGRRRRRPRVEHRVGMPPLLLQDGGHLPGKRATGCCRGCGWRCRCCGAPRGVTRGAGRGHGRCALRDGSDSSEEAPDVWHPPRVAGWVGRLRCREAIGNVCGHGIAIAAAVGATEGTNGSFGRHAATDASDGCRWRLW